MLDLGLDEIDVGNANALLPFATFFSSPVMGNGSIPFTFKHLHKLIALSQDLLETKLATISFYRFSWFC